MIGDGFIEFEIGLTVAVRTLMRSRQGTFTRLTKSVAEVTMADGGVLRFSRNSRYQIGTGLTKYNRPYICTVAEAQRRDSEYHAAQARAGARLAGGIDRPWKEHWRECGGDK